MNDTHPEAREVQYAGWRRMTPADRLAQLRSCWRTGRALGALGRRLRGQPSEVETGREQFDVTRLVTHWNGAGPAMRSWGGSRLTSGSTSTPEDVLLAKLEWYRLGNEVSERQWRDVEGIVAVQPALDLP